MDSISQNCTGRNRTARRPSAGHIPTLAIALFILLTGHGAPVLAQSLNGTATVIDGDTLDVHGTRIRLHGIDAPESGQTCLDANEEPWRCGQKAALALADHIGRAPVLCEGQDHDRYGRIIAVCTLNGKDIGAWMVRKGWAMAYLRYSDDYARDEAMAHAVGRGIWQGTVTAPWVWRKTR